MHPPALTSSQSLRDSGVRRNQTTTRGKGTLDHLPHPDVVPATTLITRRTRRMIPGPRWYGAQLASRSESATRGRRARTVTPSRRASIDRMQLERSSSHDGPQGRRTHPRSRDHAHNRNAARSKRIARSLTHLAARCGDVDCMTSRRSRTLGDEVHGAPLNKKPQYLPSPQGHAGAPSNWNPRCAQTTPHPAPPLHCATAQRRPRFSSRFLPTHSASRSPHAPPSGSTPRSPPPNQPRHRPT